ncbi:MAG: aspartate kinase [Bacteroidales bacterium]|nr:aspartate kinase [Bacteroidales bacterium]
MLEVYVEKFGGASVNSASAVRNVISILQREEKLKIVVVSAMGKTTNSLEKIVDLWHRYNKFNEEEFLLSKNYHKSIIQDLFENNACIDIALNMLESIFDELKQVLFGLNPNDYDFLYDKIVSYGERLSTAIISLYMTSLDLNHRLVPAQELIKTDNSYRGAQVDWKQTEKAVEEKFKILFLETDLIITQGFIGSTREGYTTTLGREGSDYSAAILAYCANANSLTIWKDVDGLMSADPKRMPNAQKLETVPYREAIELSYYGASVIHPKTIKPLENKSIPLYVKSFVDVNKQGSVITHCDEVKPLIPNYIFKDKQTLLSVSAKDFSFIAEDNLANIFSELSYFGVKVNLIQNSALTFSVCFEQNDYILPRLIERLQQSYNVKYNNNLQLITIRHYDEESIVNINKKGRILIEQKNRVTLQCLIEPNAE